MSDDLLSNAWSLAVEVDRLNVALTESRAEIERLRELCGEAADIIRRQQGWQEYGEQLERDADAAMAVEIQEQRRKNATLRARVREVVGPFVSHYEPWMDKHDPETQSSTFPRHTFAQLNAARQLMEEVKNA